MIDIDPTETKEWLEAIDSVIKTEGLERAQFLVEQVIDEALANGVDLPTGIHTQYCNTIPHAEEHPYPGDITLERRIRSVIRWNAIMMVLRASKKDLELGGHLSLIHI